MGLTERLTWLRPKLRPWIWYVWVLSIATNAVIFWIITMLIYLTSKSHLEYLNKS